MKKGDVYVWAALYLISGVVQPLLTDSIKHQGGTKDVPPTLLPVLANTIGMFMVQYLSTVWIYIASLWEGSSSEVENLVKKGIPNRQQQPAVRVILVATGIDLTSGILVTTGLLMVGSGTYTVIYSSTTAWTAILSWLLGKKLLSGQWIAIALVTTGLVMNGLGLVSDSDPLDEQGNAKLLFGSTILLLGTILHASAFIYNERAIRSAGVSPFLLCAQIGGIESVVLMVYNSCLVLFWSNAEALYLHNIYAAGSSVANVLFGYFILIFTNSVHALAFFAMLGQLGAVSTGILKAVLSVSVFGFAALLFCSQEKSQCVNASKLASVVIVCLGCFLYAISSPKANVSRSKTTV